MLKLREAYLLASTELEKFGSSSRRQHVFIKAEMVEDGWIFFFNSVEFAETRDWRLSVGGAFLVSHQGGVSRLRHDSELLAVREMRLSTLTSFLKFLGERALPHEIELSGDGVILVTVDVTGDRWEVSFHSDNHQQYVRFEESSGEPVVSDESEFGHAIPLR